MVVNLNLELYKKMYLIRCAERAIIENYSSDEMKTPMHMSMGEEAIAAGVCQALSTRDQVFGTYRSHALYLAKVGETDKFFAEMYGRANGVVGGKGGSMHLSLPEKGFVATSAVVASTIPVALGAAFANKYKHNKKIVVSFFGDGAPDEGVFWECINFAGLQKLPILFVCEDNDLAVHTKKQLRISYHSITEIVAKFNFESLESNSTDAEKIYALTKRILSSMKKMDKPGFLHLSYYRYLEHVGVNKDFDAGYRSIHEFKKWFKKDPLKILREKLLDGGVKEKEIIKLEKSIEIQISKSINLARKSPFPKIQEIYKNVFYEN